MKPTIVILMLLTLSGCATNPDLIVNKPVVISPPSELLKCPQTQLPDKFISNKDVAKLIVRQHADNLTCKHNMDAVKNFVDQEKVVVSP